MKSKSSKWAKPSFNTLLEWAMVMRTHEHPVWKYNAKDRGHRLAEMAGVQTPHRLNGPTTLDLIPSPQRPAVLKPVHGAASRGVVPVRPMDGGFYRQLFTGGTLLWSEILRQAAEGARDSSPQTLFIMEEAVMNGDLLAYDWKFWVIGGQPLLAWQCDHNLGRGRSRGVKWWTPAWTDAGDVAPHKVLHLDPTLPAPRNPEVLMEAAAKIAQHVDSPFIRVDLYEREDGTPVFGEITPHPFGGDIPFAAEWDERLGRAWLETGRGVL